MKEIKTICQSFIIGCSMYSRIPMPQVEWTKDGMKYALCFFPFVGIIIGGAEYIFFCLAERFGAGTLFVSLIGTVIPVLVSGGIHMDGFLDTMDALSSCESRERRIEILKDPHAGAFAVISGCVYFCIYAAVLSELTIEAVPALCGIYVMIRAASGWCIVNLPKAKKDGLASAFSQQAEHRTVSVTMLAWSAAAAAYTATIGGMGFCMLLVILLAGILLWFRFWSKKVFGGITGDLAGFFLQAAELIAIFFVALWYRIM